MVKVGVEIGVSVFLGGVAQIVVGQKSMFFLVGLWYFIMSILPNVMEKRGNFERQTRNTGMFQIKGDLRGSVQHYYGYFDCSSCGSFAW